jgi:hypothetical protein
MQTRPHRGLVLDVAMSEPAALRTFSVPKTDLQPRPAASTTPDRPVNSFPESGDSSHDTETDAASLPTAEEALVVASDTVTGWIDAARQAVRENPLAALAVAVLIGAALLGRKTTSSEPAPAPQDD